MKIRKLLRRVPRKRKVRVPDLEELEAIMNRCYGNKFCDCPKCEHKWEE